MHPLANKIKTKSGLQCGNRLYFSLGKKRVILRPDSVWQLHPSSQH